MSLLVLIGIDVVEIKRVEVAIRRSGTHFVNRICTENEVAYYQHKGDRRFLEGVAALFAAKEAVKKLFLQKEINPGWKSITIIHNSSGKPAVFLSDVSFSTVFDSISLSLSHTREYVIAAAVGVNEPQRAVL
ncbi:MAG: holo-ACP synthase [Candidatus Atribacteria bacterium]|nr:holo-ACP synthase [Candidatus Atribacteria bacterium]